MYKTLCPIYTRSSQSGSFFFSKKNAYNWIWLIWGGGSPWQAVRAARRMSSWPLSYKSGMTRPIALADPVGRFSEVRCVLLLSMQTSVYRSRKDHLGRDGVGREGTVEAGRIRTGWDGM